MRPPLPQQLPATADGVTHVPQACVRGCWRSCCCGSPRDSQMYYGCVRDVPCERIGVAAHDLVPGWAVRAAGCIVGWWSGMASWGEVWCHRREESLRDDQPLREEDHACRGHRVWPVVGEGVLQVRLHGRRSPRWVVVDVQLGWLAVSGWLLHSTSS